MSITVTKNEIDYTSAYYSLREFGNWYRSNNRTVNLGYPSKVPFIDERISGGHGGVGGEYINQDGDESPTIKVIDDALSHKPLFLDLAICSFAYQFKHTMSDKAQWIYLNKGRMMGTSSNSARMRYSALESELLAYILGVLQSQPE